MPRIYSRVKPTCHPEKRMGGNGLCKTCYLRHWRKGNPEKTKNIQQTSGKTWHQLNKNKVNAAARKRYKESSPEKKFGKRLKQFYGITYEKYQEILAAQNHLCAICKDPSKKDLVIDHDHTKGTKKGFRAILCNRCNVVVGLLESDTTRTLAAIDYLASFGNTFLLNQHGEPFQSPDIHSPPLLPN